MVELASQYGKGPAMVDSIAQKQGISKKYIHQLIIRLKAAGLVRSVRGPKGGYELTKEPDTITALEVVEVMEGKITAVECVSDSSICSRSGACVTRPIWLEVTAAIDGVLGGFNLKQLAAKQDAKQASADDYQI
jgi:Rrf2 family transcriptional regulator, cysteine metabolism repressor